MAHTHSIYNVIIGTAGHIDHGKSRLVERLTGVDPDRLKEEKQRGMTIDLGFAPYVDRRDRLVGVIDVPGHERFVKNMVAGATSVDIMLLVVAADDGVMPQTREHLQIMDILGIRRGLIVVTKRDLVEAEMLELAVEDVRHLVRGTFLEGAPILPVSSVTGEGYDELVDALEGLIAATPRRQVSGLFRMPIQRVFSAKGHGTVVTGVPVGGRIALGEEVEITPGGLKGRVRGIQAYKESWSEARAGHSTALNISDVDYRAVHRGMSAGVPGFFAASCLYEVRVRALPGLDRPLRVREPVRFHVGTAEVVGTLVLLEGEELESGQSALAQVRFAEPLAAAPGDRFLIRRPSPMQTLGGGQVIGDSERRLKRRSSVVACVRAREEAIGDPHRMLETFLKLRGPRAATLHEVAVTVKCSTEEARTFAGVLLDAGKARLLEKGSGLMHVEVFDEARMSAVAAVEQFHASHPLRKWMEMRELRAVTKIDEPLLAEVVQEAWRRGELVIDKGGKIRSARHVRCLSDAQEAQLDLLRAAYATADVTPPSPAEAAARTGIPAGDVALLIHLLVEEGELTKVGEHFFHHMAIERVRALLVELARQYGGEVVIPKLRDALGTSRKYMIPLLEYFDSQGVTTRRGEKRYARGVG
ncbi:MAG: selenocysteine-specific translation elongation factor [Planctomycetota bacterium]